MREGDLYKKILECSDRVSDKQNETYDAVELDTINDLLDDVAKDFPDLLVDNKDGSLTFNPNQVIAIQLWFKKHFGERIG